MKLLNLDDLGNEPRTVVLNGKEHQIKDQSIQQLINSVKIRKVAKEEDTESVFLSLVKSAQELLPTAPKKEITDLNVRQLQALIAYSSATPEELEQVAGDETEGKQ